VPLALPAWLANCPLLFHAPLCRLDAHMHSRPGSMEQVYVTQMLRPLAAAIDAALETYRSEVALYAKMQQAATARADR
jgi:hypothetical protein